MTSVLVLGGGPDAERAVSVNGARAVAAALNRSGEFEAREEIIDRVDGAWLAARDEDVVWPLLHGPWGEGGPMQDLLEADGRPFVGSGARAARLAMDKMATKLIAARLGVRTASGATLNPSDGVCPFDLPVVVKPTHEGSTIGLSVCRADADWRAAHERARGSGRTYMVEAMVKGREVTAPVIEREGRLEALPLVEIRPAGDLYDYEAKYDRDDTTYVVRPDLPAETVTRATAQTLAMCDAMGLRGLARADFIVTDAGEPMFLEINTMPGFVDHSLLPMAARAVGLEMPDLCATIVREALASER